MATLGPLQFTCEYCPPQGYSITASSCALLHKGGLIVGAARGLTLVNMTCRTRVVQEDKVRQALAYLEKTRNYPYQSWVIRTVDGHGHGHWHGQRYIQAILHRLIEGTAQTQRQDR